MSAESEIQDNGAYTGRVGYTHTTPCNPVTAGVR
jgi:hypothetical protein